MHCLERKKCIRFNISLKSVHESAIDNKPIIGGLVPLCQAITLTYIDKDQWGHMVSPGHKELNKYTLNKAHLYAIVVINN